MAHRSAIILAMDHSRPVAIVVPMEGELAPYRGLLSSMRPLDGAGPWEMFEAEAGGRRVVLILSGPGPVNAGAATERVIAQTDPVAVLHGGSAGAHNPDLLPGDVVLGSRYVILTPRTVRDARLARGLHPSLIRFRRDGEQIGFHHIETDTELLQHAERVARGQLEALGPWQAPGWPPATPPRVGQVISGVIGSADAWTVDPDELRALHEDFGAECEDMESAYVAQVCALHRLPFIAVRAMSDNEAAHALTPADVPVAIAAAGERAALVITRLAAEL